MTDCPCRPDPTKDCEICGDPGKPMTLNILADAVGGRSIGAQWGFEKPKLIEGLKPSGEYILFTFLDGLWNGTVSEKTAWGFEFQVSTANTVQPARWGLVHAVGENVKYVQPGQYVFIEPLGWTEYGIWKDQKIWWTAETRCYLVTDERPQG